MVKCTFESCAFSSLNHEFNPRSCPMDAISSFYARWESKSQTSKLSENILPFFDDIASDISLKAFHDNFSKAKYLMTAMPLETAAAIIQQFLADKDHNAFEHFHIFVKGACFALRISPIYDFKSLLEDIKAKVSEISNS